MFQHHVKNCTLLILCTVCSWELTAPLTHAEDKPVEKNGIQAIFRMSKSFLDDVTDDEITADIPVSAMVLGFHCTGVIHGEGTMAVDLLDGADAAVFAIDSQGDGTACIKGVRGPIVAIGPAWGPFTSRTLVQFDGREFMHLETTPWARVYGQLQRVTNRRDGPMGRLAGAAAKPIGKHLIPRVEVQAKPIAEYYLDEFVEDLAAKIIEKLNEKTPVEESVNRLFPKTKGWVFQVSGDTEFIQAAYGPPNAQVPALPDLPSRTEDVRLEAWLHSTGEEAKLLAGLSKRPMARQLVQKYLESTLPRLAALAEERTVTAVEDWVVISVGPPKTAEADKLIPETSEIIDRILDQ